MSRIHSVMASSLLFTALTPPLGWAEDSTPRIPPTAQVSRAAFTTSINAREPVDQLTRISAGQAVYYFTELSGLQGHVVTHRWEKDGTFQLSIQFPIGAERWRVHSSKNITNDMPGIWTVSVQNDDGTVLKQDTLIVDPVLSSTKEANTTPTKIPTPQPVTTEPSPSPSTPTAEPAENKATDSSKPIWDSLAR